MTEKEEHRAEIRSLVVDWVNERMDAGDTLPEAADHTIDRIIKARKGSTFLLECGPHAVSDIWRLQNTHKRNIAQRPGMRKVDPSALQEDESVLDSLFKVGDEWMRVGDMDQKMCRDVQRDFNKQAEGNVRQAQFFSRIADNLKPGETVQSRFTDDQLRAFVQEVRVE